MKANLIRKSTIAVVLLITASFTDTFAQAPIYRFRNSSLISGTGGQINAVYRFPNVNTSGANIDALVKIQDKVGNITLQNIDRTADGYDEAFQPEYKIGSNTNAYFEFLITFVQSGTFNPVSQPMVDVSGLDIDGSTSGALTLKEFNRIDMGGGICTFNLLNSQLTLSQVGTAYNGANFTGTLFGALVDTAAKEVMFSVSNVNVTNITYRAGSNSLLNGSSTRYASLYFKKFNYPNGVILSTRNLASFTGNMVSNQARLSWTLAEANDANLLVLEKSNDGQVFRAVSEFWPNIEGNMQREFSYKDQQEPGATVTYYRIKLVNVQGKLEYSNILRFQSQEDLAERLSIYPSIVRTATTVSYNSPRQDKATLLVSDLSGRVVKQQTVLLQAGINNVQLSGFDQFSKGNYIIAVMLGGQRSGRQVVVQ
jgi:hypothetical protein